MKCHLLVPLVVASILLGALPALASGHGPAITISARLGDLAPRISHRPPAIVIVREPRRERVIIVERALQRRHEYRDYERRQESCGERSRWNNGERRHNRRELHHEERVVTANRGWERRDN